MTTRSSCSRSLCSLCRRSAIRRRRRRSCDGLKSLSLANTVVTTARGVTGSFTPPGATNPNATIANLPAFCRVAVTLETDGRLRHQD